jgi:hypothetical protein
LERRLAFTTPVVSVTVSEAPPPSAPTAPEEVRSDAPGDDVEPDSSPSAADVGAPEDDDAPHWPDEAAESAFLGGQPDETLSATSAGAGGAAPARVQGDEGDSGPPVSLPQLQSLVDRIPAEAMETLDELFRARFVSVKRVQKRSLKGSEAIEA